MKKSLSPAAGLILVVAGAAAGVILRLLCMLRGFDFDTCFYTDGGVTAWLSLLIPLACAGAAACIFIRRKDGFQAYTRRRDILSGALSAFSGAILLYGSIAMLQDYNLLHTIGYSQLESSQRPALHFFLLITSAVFGVVLLAAAMGFATGLNLFRKAPLLYGAGVLWGMANLVVAYVLYANESAFVENFFAVGGGALLLLGLVYACKLLAGSDERQSARRMMIWGGLGAAATVPCHLVNLVLFFSGRTYQGQIPAVLSLCMLSVGLFLLALMVGYCRTSTGEAEHF